MQIIIKSTNLSLTPSLRIYIEKKLGRIDKLVKKFDTGGATRLHLEVARTTKHHHKGQVFMAEANLFLPKRTLRAVEKSYNLRTAIDILKHKLHLEIIKYKTRFAPRKNKD